MQERGFDPHLDMIETSFQTINFMSAQYFLKNFKACIANALYCIDPSAEVLDIVDEVWSPANHLLKTASYFSPKNISQVQSEVLEIIKRLRLEMHKCPPSRTAIILGMD